MCCPQYASKFGKTQQWPQDWKRSVFIQISKKGNVNCRTLVHISHASKVMLKILQARLQQYVNWELSDVQAVFRKGRGTRDQIANILWIIEKAKEFQKTKSTSVSLTMLKPLTVWITTNWKILKEMGIPDHLTCLLRNLYAGQEATVRTGHGTTPKLGKGYVKAVYCYPACLNYMQSTSWEMLDWRNTRNTNQDCREKYQ